MQMESGQSDPLFLRKRQKGVQNDHFGYKKHIFELFSRMGDRIDLNPFASCQATSGTSLEYPHGILW